MGELLYVRGWFLLWGVGLAWLGSGCGRVEADGLASGGSVATASIGGSTGGSSEGTGGDGCAPADCDPDLEQCVAGNCLASQAVQEGTPMVSVPGGSFLMGYEGSDTSSPTHERKVESFSMDVTEVTAGAYDLCLDAGACSPVAATGPGVNSGAEGYDNYPMNYVTLEQAAAYCAWMGKRLPTEAEWEYAAGGRQGQAFPWGNAEPSACLAILGPPSLSEPLEGDVEHGCAVGQFPPNENGLLDMGGSMYELTSSPYCPYSASAESGYVDACSAASFALRDGGFTAFAVELARVASRQPVEVDFGHQSIGFRCARDE